MFLPSVHIRHLFLEPQHPPETEEKAHAWSSHSCWRFCKGSFVGESGEVLAASKCICISSTSLSPMSPFSTSTLWQDIVQEAVIFSLVIAEGGRWSWFWHKACSWDAFMYPWMEPLPWGFVEEGGMILSSGTRDTEPTWGQVPLLGTISPSEWFMAQIQPGHTCKDLCWPLRREACFPHAILLWEDLGLLGFILSTLHCYPRAILLMHSC